MLAAEVNGYLDERTFFSRARTSGLLSTRDNPELLELLEGNVQAKQEYHRNGRVAFDLSLFVPFGGRFRDVDAEGNEVAVADHDTQATTPRVSLNELYVSHDLVPALTLLVGKKRVVWGSGFAYNPTDLLNPKKDPTDPNQQRAGTYMARVEVPLERFTFTVLASPAVLKETSGLPSRFLVDEGDEAHYLVAARAYALWFDSDLNLMGFFGNRYADPFRDKPRLGLSFSRNFFVDYEAHFEGLLQTGSSRQLVSGECVDDRPSAVRCILAGTPVVEARRLADSRLYPKVLVGGRRQFGDDAMLSVEYLYRADGYSKEELTDALKLLQLAKEARLGALGPVAQFAVSQVDPSALRFSFEPFTRHTLFASFQKSRIRDDFSLGLTLLASLSDWSGMLVPQAGWSVKEWLSLTLTGMVPFAGPQALALTLPRDGGRVWEYSLVPFRYQAFLEARLFY